MATTMAEAKGNNLVSALQLLLHGRGEAGVAAVLDRLEPALRDRLRSRAVINSGWYPVAWYDQLLAAATGELAGGGLDATQKLGHDLVQADMQGIYRLLVKMISPAMIISWGPRTFGQYYRGGTVVVPESKGGSAVVDYAGWHGFTPRLWHSVMGGSRAALRACGAKVVSGRIASLGADASGCQMRFDWH